MFVVFSLPRSRSAWLSKFLAYKDRFKVGHDLGSGAQSLQELKELLRSHDGTVETGSVLGWAEIADEFPNARIVTIHRPLIEVCRSLEKLGVSPNLIDLGRKEYLLRQIPGAMQVEYGDLNRLGVCGDVFERCVGLPFDLGWWEGLAPINIQVNVGEQLLQVQNNFANLAYMKACVGPRRFVQGELTITNESFAAAWPEAQELAMRHWKEIEPESPRKFNLDLEAMMRLWGSGHMYIFVARLSSRLVGYITWNLSFDVESYGNLQAEQGAWFVDEEFAGVGGKLFDYSVQQLKETGVKYYFCHNRMLGRGVELGKFFRRREAVEVQHTYYKWID